MMMYPLPHAWEKERENNERECQKDESWDKRQDKAGYTNKYAKNSGQKDDCAFSVSYHGFHLGQAPTGRLQDV
jgi:hypothetical protein